MYDPLCKLADVKAWLKIGPQDDSQDTALDSLIASCSELIGQYCGRDNLGAVLTKQENRFMAITSLPKPDYAPLLVVNFYPIVALTSVLWNGTTVPILTAAQLQGTLNISGVFVGDDARTLRFLGMYMPPSYGAIQLNYTAGYYLDTAVTGAQMVPAGLQQACIQWCGEIYKSVSWIGFKSKSLAGETTAFDMGGDWGMSPRTKAMLQPYRNRVPLM